MLVRLHHHLTGVAGVVEGVTRQDLPMIEHTLGEGLATCVGPQASSEAKGLIDRQVGLHDKYGGASQLGLLEDVAPLPLQDTTDATSHFFWTLDLHKVDGLCEPGLGGQHTGVQAVPGHGDDLAAPTEDGISVQRHIMNVKAHTLHVLLAQRPILGGPLEASHYTVHDFIEVLHALGDVCEDAGAHAIRAEAPDLVGLGHIPLTFLSQVVGPLLELLAQIARLCRCPWPSCWGKAVPSCKAQCARWGTWTGRACLASH